MTFAFFSAFLASINDALNKKALKEIDEYTISWLITFLTFLFMVPLILISGIPAVKSGFWIALLVDGTLNAFAQVLYLKAIKDSDLSKCIPVLAFLPVFLLFTSSFMLNEKVGALGIFGVVLIAAGSYVLNIQGAKEGILTPFALLFKDKGPRIMLIISLIYSITSNYDKIGVRSSSAFFWIFAINGYIALLLFPLLILVIKKSDNFTWNFKPVLQITPVALINLAALIFQMVAVGRTLVSYVISIKRLNTVFSVLIGYFIFKEKRIHEKLIGVAIMLMGVILITVFK